jgi:hypothetical protein
VQAGSRLYTDSASSYRAVKGYLHEYVNHTKKEYARGEVHELTFRTLFRTFAAIFEEPPVEGGSGAIARRSHAP